MSFDKMEATLFSNDIDDILHVTPQFSALKENVGMIHPFLYHRRLTHPHVSLRSVRIPTFFTDLILL